VSQRHLVSDVNKARAAGLRQDLGNFALQEGVVDLQLALGKRTRLDPHGQFHHAGIACNQRA